MKGPSFVIALEESSTWGMKLYTKQRWGQGNGMRPSEVIVDSTSGSRQWYSFRCEASWLTGTSRAPRDEIGHALRGGRRVRFSLKRLGNRSQTHACFWSVAMERVMGKERAGGSLLPW